MSTLTRQPLIFQRFLGLCLWIKKQFFSCMHLGLMPSIDFAGKNQKKFFFGFCPKFSIFKKKNWKFLAWVDLLCHCPYTLQVSKRSVGKQASYDFLMNFCYFLVKIQNGARPKINPPLDAEFDGASNPGLSFSLTLLKTE